MFWAFAFLSFYRRWGRGDFFRCGSALFLFNNVNINANCHKSCKAYRRCNSARLKSLWIIHKLYAVLALVEVKCYKRIADRCNFSFSAVNICGPAALFIRNRGVEKSVLACVPFIDEPVSSVVVITSLLICAYPCS